MVFIDIGDASLAAVSRGTRQAAALPPARMPVNAGWATSLVIALVTSRADPAVRQVQDSLRGTLLAPPAPPAAPEG